MAKEKEETEETEGKGGGRKKLIIIIVVPVLLLLIGAGWFFFLKPDKGGAAEPLPEPTPGAVMKLDPITVNLAGGHFLKLGMAIQPTATAHEVDGSKVLDLAISEFSQMTIDELSTTEGRTKAKEELVARIKLTYLPHGTHLSAVTSTAPAKDKEPADGAEKPAEAKDHAEADKDHAAAEEIHIEDLSAADVIKLADSLTVQAEVYDVYFTEFVMQ